MALDKAHHPGPITSLPSPFLKLFSVVWHPQNQLSASLKGISPTKVACLLRGLSYLHGIPLPSVCNNGWTVPFLRNPFPYCRVPELTEPSGSFSFPITPISPLCCPALGGEGQRVVASFIYSLQIIHCLLFCLYFSDTHI